MLGRLAAPAAAAGCLDLDRIEALEKDGGLIQLEEKGAAAQLGELRDFIRDGIASSDEKLAGLFWQGRDVVELVHARAWVVEQMLLLAWKKLVPYLEGVGLVAVGGYGRGELHPHSDIDLLILLDDDIGDQLPREESEAFVQLLWDAGFYLGHAVRTVAECVESCPGDVVTATTLMETRLLAGEITLLNQMIEALSLIHI